MVNLGEDRVTRSFSLPELGIPAPAFFHRWQPGRATRLGRLPRLEVALGRHQAALFYVARTDTAPPADLGLCGERIPGLRAVG